MISSLHYVFQEYKACNLEACPEVRRNTPWTPWMPVNVSQDGSRQEQRFRYTCRALLPDPQQLQLGKKKVETRFCPNDGSGACQTDCECWEWTGNIWWKHQLPFLSHLLRRRANHKCSHVFLFLSVAGRCSWLLPWKHSWCGNYLLDCRCNQMKP